MDRFARISYVTALLGLAIVVGCARNTRTTSSPERAAGPSSTIVFRVADSWPLVQKHWQFHGKDAEVCREGERSPVPKVYGAGVPWAEHQVITDTVIMAAPAYSQEGAIGDTILRFAVSLPDEPSELTFGAFLFQTSAPSDGVTFKVRIDEAVVFEETISSYEAQQRTVDLVAYAGRDVTVELVTTPGPDSNISADWALWLDPKIVLKG